MFRTISKERDLRVLKKAIEAEGLEEAVATTDPITVFGPTNCAFERNKCCDDDLKQVLLYHVVPESLPFCRLQNDTLYPTLRVDDNLTRKVRINIYSKPFKCVETINGVVIEDCEEIKAKNGYLYKIEKVLTPPCGTIYQNLEKLEEFSTLVAAIKKAGLVDTLNDPNSSLTLFAPTNSAFEELLCKLDLTADQLLASPQLADILSYHLLFQTVFSVAICEGYTWYLTTLLPTKYLTLKRNGKKIKVMDELRRKSKVVGKNLLSEGGVIHSIDKVLLPYQI